MTIARVAGRHDRQQIENKLKAIGQLGARLGITHGSIHAVFHQGMVRRADVLRRCVAESATGSIETSPTHAPPHEPLTDDELIDQMNQILAPCAIEFGAVTFVIKWGTVIEVVPSPRRRAQGREIDALVGDLLTGSAVTGSENC